MKPQDTFVEICISIHNEKMDDAIGLLYKFGFEYFREEPDLLIAYLPHIQFTSEIEQSIKHEIFNLFQAKIISYNIIKPQNWNKEWEDSLESFIVGRFEIIPHVSMNDQIPDKESSNLIPLYITPEMSFGTGTHETTQLMLEQLDKYLCPNDIVLDVGTGTGILAIACRKLNNHNFIYGIDNDEWSVKNAISNVERNKCQNIHIIRGDAMYDVLPLLKSNPFNFILANLNRGVLEKTLPLFLNTSSRVNKILLSGLLTYDDIQFIFALCFNQWEVKDDVTKNEWRCLILEKHRF